MAQLSLSRAWEEARQIFARDGGLLSAVALALLLLPEVVAGLVAPSVGSTPSVPGRVISLLAAFVGVIGQLALIRLALGPSTTVGQAISHGARRFPVTLGALLILICGLALILIPLMAVLIAAGVIQLPGQGQANSPSLAVLAMVLAVLSLFVAVKFIMSVPVASAESAGPLEILKRSWRLTNGNYWPLLGLELLLLVAALVLLISAQLVGGTLAQLVGGDITPFSLAALILALFIGLAQAVFTVLASVMLARIYVQLAGRPEAQASVPTTGI